MNFDTAPVVPCDSRHNDRISQYGVCQKCGGTTLDNSTTSYKGVDMDKTADCGVKFDHAPHVYRTERGKVKACDGNINKRNK